MVSRNRAVRSVELGAAACTVPALAWAYIMTAQARDPAAFEDQGGMLISLVLFPLALLGAVACGVPAVVLGGRRAGTAGLVGFALGMVAILLAFGTCILPVTLVQTLGMGK